ADSSRARAVELEHRVAELEERLASSGSASSIAATSIAATSGGTTSSEIAPIGELTLDDLELFDVADAPRSDE
ncbi:MAG: hypothetical protein M3Y87_34210, partial [Myxococcota bacterium]|nr:hypothetical protein [Myxococcota bacterium]